jgi:hypothetical protein
MAEGRGRVKRKLPGAGLKDGVEYESATATVSKELDAE